MSYRPGDVTTQPSGWWKLNEQSGTRYDSIGSVDLTDNGGTLYTNGITETDAMLGQTNDYLSHAGNAIFAVGTGDFSIVVWVKNTTAASYRLMDIGGWSANNFSMIGNSSTEALTLYSDASSVKVYAGVIADESVWQHITFLRSSGTIRLYVDAVQKGTDLSNSNDISDSDFYLNAWKGIYTGGMANSAWQDLAIWKGYALSETEIGYLAANAGPPVGGASRRVFMIT